MPLVMNGGALQQVISLILHICVGQKSLVYG